MSKWRMTCFLGVLLGMSGLVLTISGCGPSGGQTGGGPSPEVKSIPPVGSSTPVSEEYKNLSPAGKAVR